MKDEHCRAMEHRHADIKEAVELVRAAEEVDLAFLLDATSSMGRGLHSFTFQLKVSAFYGIRGAIRGYSWGDYEVLGSFRGCKGCVFVSETAQVELRSGRV